MNASTYLIVSQSRNTAGLVVRYFNMGFMSSFGIVTVKVFRHKNNGFVVFRLIIQENIRDFTQYTATSL